MTAADAPVGRLLTTLRLGENISRDREPPLSGRDVGRDLFRARHPCARPLSAAHLVIVLLVGIFGRLSGLLLRSGKPLLPGPRRKSCAGE